jgi:hypothetical protein
MLATALCYVGLGMLIGRLATTTSRAAWSAVLLAGLMLALQAVPALSPAGWSRLAIQTAVTGTGTRAAASGLAALAGLGVLALLAARLVSRRWPLALLVVGWLMLAGFVWLRPGPPLPQADMLPVSLAAPLPPDAGRVAPIATTPPDAALTSALARVTRQIGKWPPAADPDPVQRARNLLLIAAVADLYDTDPLQSHLPLLVEAELRKRLPADQLPALLTAIAARPGQGSVAAREMPPNCWLGSEQRHNLRLCRAEAATRPVHSRINLPPLTGTETAFRTHLDDDEAHRIRARRHGADFDSTSCRPCLMAMTRIPCAISAIATGTRSRDSRGFAWQGPQQHRTRPTR